MRLDPKALASRLGCQADRLVPSIIDCPLCGSSGKLEIRRTQHCHCAECGFVGDLIELCSAKEGKSLEATIASLIAAGSLDMRGGEKSYLAAATLRRKMQGFISEKADSLRGAAPASFLAAMSLLNCRMFTEVPVSLRRHMFPLTKAELLALDIPLPKEADETLKWWGKYGAVSIPAYDGPDVAGMWLITQKGERYLPLLSRKVASNGFGLIPSMADSHVFVVDSVRDAVRMTVWSSLHRRQPLGFICPSGLVDSPENYSAKRCIFWSTSDDPAWALRARHSPNSLIVSSQSIGGYSAESFPCQGDFSRFLSDIDAAAVPNSRGIAQRLLSLPPQQVAELIVNDPLDAGDRAKILAYVSGEDQRELGRLFTSSQPIVVSWDNIPVTETADGWTVKGRTICSVKFYMDKLRPLGDSGDAIVSGSLVHMGRSVSFEERLSILRRNTASWLEGIAVSRFGIIAYIATSWRGRLLELSQQFRKPVPIMPDQRYGWDGGALRMPLFIVDDKAITPSYDSTQGPQIALPEPFSEADKDSFHNESFCKLFLIFLRNLLQTRTGPGSGWILVNQPHVVSNAATALGIDLVNDPSDAMLSATASDPIPCLALAGPASAKRILSSQRPLNTIFSVDSLTGELAQVFTQWPTVSITHNMDYRCLRGIFLAAHYCLATAAVSRSYQELAKQVCACFDRTGRLAAAGLMLDCVLSYTPRTHGARLVQLLVHLHEKGIIHPKVTHEGISVTHDELYAYMAKACIDLPSHTEIRDKLITAQCLSGIGDKYWAISSDAWMLYSKQQVPIQIEL